MTDEPKNLDAILRKIQALLAQADHPNTGAKESEAFRDKAESLMQKYRIEESAAAARGEAPSLKPVVRLVDICPVSSRYAYWYRYIYSASMQHAGVKSVYMRHVGPEGTASYVGEAVGFESDVRYGEMLYTAARLVFQDRMEPRIDPAMTDQENVYRLRRSGVERKRIGEMMGWEKAGQRVTRLYEAECKKRGESAEVGGKGFNVKMYRESYCEHFIDEFWGRLSRMRLNRGQDGAIVLKSRQNDVDEAFYQRHPHLRPTGVVEPYTPLTAAERRRMQKQAEKDLRDRMRKAMSSSYQAGAGAGRSAAQQVDLGGSPRKERLS